ncbi:MAG: FAD:protein FMN transferase [Flavobacteriales bacterium]|nr:FAD:protein FMN transferase [Flavobacteriales bacterium]MCB9196334.1 FAD:protein FMN transferase [Flavobacteriales bacterium]
MRYWGILLATLFLWSCGTTEETQTESVEYYQILGEAQGTTYSIIYEAGKIDPIEVKSSVDSILSAYDLQNSIYKPGSLISLLNDSWESSFSLDSFPENNYFQTCFNVSKEVHQLTDGAFNPAVYPLVSYWGFHKADFNYEPDSLEIKNLLKLIDFSNSNFRLENDAIVRSNPESKIDFNALAQGHSVDVLANYLEDLGSENYMIELGGEIKCKGNNPDKNLWRVGIDKPIENSDPGENGFQFIASLTNISLATSGNYRKYYEIDGQKYSHTIDPITGYPAKQNLLSVTVLSPDCVYADAFATAFMVMGLESSLNFIHNHEELGLHAYFIYDENGAIQTKMTEGFEKFMLQ